MNLISRSIVFVITLLFIYLLFPILIVPSSLPAIQQMITGQEAASDIGICFVVMFHSSLPFIYKDCALPGSVESSLFERYNLC